MLTDLAKVMLSNHKLESAPAVTCSRVQYIIIGMTVDSPLDLTFEHHINMIVSKAHDKLFAIDDAT